MQLLTNDVMPVRCSGCAYSVGTEANRDELTTLTRELCELGRVPFYCHANAVEDVLPKQGKRICFGFFDVMMTQTITGQEPPRWKRLLAEEALRMMEEAEHGATSSACELDREAVARTLVNRVQRRIEGDTEPTDNHRPPAR